MARAGTSAWIRLASVALASTALLRWQMKRWFTEHPRFVLERRIGPLEIRRYAPHWVAETRVESSWEGALAEGFRRLAGYISGSHHRQPSGPQRSATPESAHFGGASAELGSPDTRPTEHERIAMISPVQMQRSAPLSELSAARRGTMSHVITFHLPRGRTAKNLPAPDDARVELKLRPETRVAALRFRGHRDAETMASRSLELLIAVRRAGLHYRGNPQFAAYDPPATFPLLRRNEVWVELDAS